MSPRRKLNDRTVASARYAGAEKARCVIWDTLPGFGLRITPEGGKSYVLSYRHGGKKRLLSLGNVELHKSVDTARTKARRMLMDLKERGIDPAAARETLRDSETVASLYATYSKTVLSAAPANSRKVTASVYKLHILPALGSERVASLDAAAVQRMHDKATASGKVVANRAVERLSASSRGHTSGIGRASRITG